MRHLLLARTNLDRFLPIVLAVFFCVFLFNSCRLGKLKKYRAWLLGLAAVLLAAVLALFSFRTAGNEDLVLKQQGNTVYFMFDTDTAMRFGDRRVQTDDGALLD
ncbi:MAG: hypothetical protein IIV78_06415, partial [Oscillospiraceae bacterium]|nr:hypothetical protein [Oscillospiraceae bacterium]